MIGVHREGIGDEINKHAALAGAGGPGHEGSALLSLPFYLSHPVDFGSVCRLCVVTIDKRASSSETKLETGDWSAQRFPAR